MQDINVTYGPNGQTIWPDGTVSPNYSYTPQQVGAIMGNGSSTPTPNFGASGGGSGGASLGGGMAVSAPPAQGSSVAGTTNGQSNYMDQTNPYLQKQMDAVTSTMTGNFNRNVLPGISSQAMAAGGFGGSRQGVIEANAMNDFNQQLGGALAGLGGNAFGQQLQYDLGRRNNDLGYGNLGLGYYNAANSYDLGRGNLGLGYANLDRNINNDNNQWALQGANLSNSVWNQLMGNNQTGLNAGTNIQNNPLNYLNQFGNLFNGIGSGFGTSTGTTNVSGNPLLGALGGAQLGGQIGNLWGMSGGNRAATNAANANGTGLDGLIGGTGGWGTIP